MKKITTLLAVAFALIGTSVMAQQDFSGAQYAKWGDTPEVREANIMASNFLAESVKSRNYDEASIHLNHLIANRPEASVNTFKYGKMIYRAKINAAAARDIKNKYVDSLLQMYDLQAKYFGQSGKESTADIMGNKAKEILLYRPTERGVIRTAFCKAITEGGAQADPEIIAIYFKNLCDDCQSGAVAADEVINEYERLAPLFVGRPEAAENKAQFDAAFSLSGVANCDNLERIFKAKLAVAPNDEKILSQAVSLLSKAQCTSAFFFQTAEKFYAVKPSSDTAMALAGLFQEQRNYDKAVKYLNEALAVEKVTAKREELLSRIALVELVANHISSAASSARQTINLNPENGLAYFVLAQCYASSASGCAGLEGQAAYWAAYDTMSKAVNFMNEEQETSFGQSARVSMAGYRNRFPTSEECFFAELKEGQRYTVACGIASGVATTVRCR
ncbi:MAG: enzyme of heme biosynthesis [Alistipes sp.]